MTYKLKCWYPSLPKTWEKGTILIIYAPIVGFAYYSDIYDSFQVSKTEVENNPKWYKKI